MQQQQHLHAGVTAFSEVLADVTTHGKYSLALYDMGRFMRLDAAAQRALNVMKTKFDANDNFSLYGLMSKARTTMGKRLLKVSASLLTPIMMMMWCSRLKHDQDSCDLGSLV